VRSRIPALRGRTGGRAGGAAPAVPFSPLDLASLHAWYRADDVVTGAGDRISTWTDKSANGDNLTQGTDGARPTQVTRYGQECASFDGGDYLAGAFTAALTQTFSYAIVCEVTNFAAARSIMDSDDLTNRLWINTAATTGVYGQYAGVNHLGGTFTAATVAAVFGEINGASSKSWFNDWTNGAVDSGNAGAHAADGLTLGANAAAGAKHLGFISEVVVINAALSTADRKSLGDYLGARYDGLSVTT
jgi:hypothetical protein